MLKSKLDKIISILVATFLQAGCATAPQLPHVELKPRDRIGIFVESGNSPSHVHIGYSSFRGRFPAFPSFNRAYPYSWDLQPAVAKSVEDSLRRAGFTVVDLRKEGYGFDDVAGLVMHTPNGWEVPAKKESIFRTLKEQSGIKAVVLLKESPVTVLVECFSFPTCTEYKINTSGLYTHSMYGLTNYHAVAAFTWNVFVLDPLVDIAQWPTVGKVLKSPAMPIRDFAKPVNFEDVTQAEFEPVREAVIRIVEDNASVVATALKNGNLRH